MLTQKQVNELFHYKDGILYWKIKPSRNVEIGSVAGSVSVQGYMVVTINDRQYKSHRVIFLYHKGYLPEFIDHIDRIKGNCKIENLRPATTSQNICNSKLSKNNNSGIKGVSWCKRAKKWVVSIQVNGKRKSLGAFWDLYTAELTARRERVLLHGDYANNG